ncbi:hypothetical protein [Paenibacillus sp. NAIST15-1]|uniref:hypothetical protein n=1 Tax=Paenibacillus sp. NAIST15-1 TaxID=1605994 RepID=UPI000869AD58|nr:hypothetical protein [Paenibacillus sp. NAIST15-1]GAV11368.1 hypothetical protein PBN151_1295 [Paenibacillus sp. NAIST15-1]
MKLPKEIKSAIRKSAKHYAAAREANNIVRDYLDQVLGSDYCDSSAFNKVGHDFFLDQLIDGTEIGCDPENVIKFFENNLPDEDE